MHLSHQPSPRCPHPGQQTPRQRHLGDRIPRDERQDRQRYPQRVTTSRFSTAYHKALDEDGYHSIGVGFQGTYANQNLDGTRLTFEDGLQLDGTFLRSPTEAINSEFVSVHYFDADLGVLYNASTDGNNNFYLGASAYHLNRPKASFLGVDTINIPIRMTIHGGGFFPLAGTASTIYISGLVSNQAGARQYVLGGAWAVCRHYR